MPPASVITSFLPGEWHDVGAVVAALEAVIQLLRHGHMTQSLLGKAVHRGQAFAAEHSLYDELPSEAVTRANAALSMSERAGTVFKVTAAVTARGSSKSQDDTAPAKSLFAKELYYASTHRNGHVRVMVFEAPGQSWGQAMASSPAVLVVFPADHEERSVVHIVAPSCKWHTQRGAGPAHAGLSFATVQGLKPAQHALLQMLAVRDVHGSLVSPGEDAPVYAPQYAVSLLRRCSAKRSPDTTATAQTSAVPSPAARPARPASPGQSHAPRPHLHTVEHVAEPALAPARASPLVSSRQQHGNVEPAARQHPQLQAASSQHALFQPQPEQPPTPPAHAMSMPELTASVRDNTAVRAARLADIQRQKAQLAELEAQILALGVDQPVSSQPAPEPVPALAPAAHSPSSTASIAHEAQRAESVHTAECYSDTDGASAPAELHKPQPVQVQYSSSDEQASGAGPAQELDQHAARSDAEERDSSELQELPEAAEAQILSSLRAAGVTDPHIIAQALHAARDSMRQASASPPRASQGALCISADDTSHSGKHSVYSPVEQAAIPTTTVFAASRSSDGSVASAECSSTDDSGHAAMQMPMPHEPVLAGEAQPLRMEPDDMLQQSLPPKPAVLVDTTLTASGRGQSLQAAAAAAARRAHSRSSARSVDTAPESTPSHDADALPAAPAAPPTATAAAITAPRTAAASSSPSSEVEQLASADAAARCSDLPCHAPAELHAAIAAAQASAAAVRGGWARRGSDASVDSVSEQPRVPVRIDVGSGSEPLASAAPKRRSLSTSRQRPPSRPRSRAAHLSNTPRIRNALRFVLLAGRHRAPDLAAALQAMDHAVEDGAEQFVVLFRSPTQQLYKGLYAVQPDESGVDITLRRVHGLGPLHLPPSLQARIQQFYKFSTGARTFDTLPVNSITGTTDAVSIVARGRGAHLMSE